MGVVTRLTALVPGSVCATALGRAWPDDVDGRVRCIDEGTRALGLAMCCTPWSKQAEDAELLSELAGDAALLSRGAEGGVLLSELAGDGARLSRRGGGGSPIKRVDDAGADDAIEGPDAVASGLVLTPGAPPVLGLVSGPLCWGTRQAPGAGRGMPIDPVEAIDAASDLAAGRIRALAGCGVQRIAVVELGAPDLFLDTELAAEFHEAVIRAADHLRVGLLLIAPDPIAGVASPGEFGYERWVSSDGCSEGLGFLAQSAFKSTGAVARSVRRMSAVAEVVTGPLGPDVGAETLRSAAALVAETRPAALT